MWRDSLLIELNVTHSLGKNRKRKGCSRLQQTYERGHKLTALFHDAFQFEPERVACRIILLFMSRYLMKYEPGAVSAHYGCIAAAHQNYTASVTVDPGDKYFRTHKRDGAFK